MFFPLLCCPLVRVDTGLMLTNAEFSMLGLSIMTDYLLSSLPTSFYTCLTYGGVFSPRIQLWTRSSLDLDPPENQMPSPFQVSAWTSHYLLDISKHSPDRYLTLIIVDEGHYSRLSLFFLLLYSHALYFSHHMILRVIILIKVGECHCFLYLFCCRKEYITLIDIRLRCVDQPRHNHWVLCIPSLETQVFWIGHLLRAI